MKGDVVEIQISHDTLGDGTGNEVDATLVRLWVEGETYDDDGDLVVAAELRIDETAHSELDGLRDFLRPYLDGFGIGDPS